MGATVPQGPGPLGQPWGWGHIGWLILEAPNFGSFPLPLCCSGLAAVGLVGWGHPHGLGAAGQGATWGLVSPCFSGGMQVQFLPHNLTKYMLFPDFFFLTDDFYFIFLNIGSAFGT